MDPVTYVSQGEDDRVDRMFVEKLEEATKNIYETFKEPRPMIFNEAAKTPRKPGQVLHLWGKV